MRRHTVAAGVCLLLAAPVVAGGIEPAAAAPVTTPPTAFEIDGNLVVNTTGDWNSTAALYPSLRDNASLLEVCNDNPVVIDGVETTARPPVSHQAQSSMGPRLLPRQPSSPATSRGRPTSAVLGAWELVESPAGQYQFVVYGGWSRPVTNGEIDVLIPLLGSNSASAEDDLVLSYDFIDSTQTTNFAVSDFVGGTWTPIALQAGSFAAVTTENTVIDPALPGQPLTFGEFALNLTVNNILPANGPCTTFTTGTVYTRTGNSPNSTMEDAVTRRIRSRSAPAAS